MSTGTRNLLLSALLILFSFNSFAQEPPKVKNDSIFMLSGDVIACKIRQVSSSKVKYKEVGKEEGSEVMRKHVEYVKYKTGRIERFNKPILQLLSEGDYKTVILSENENDASGMYEVGVVTGKSTKRAKSLRQAQKNAEIRIQKRAAKIGGTIVIITKREAKGGYGEVPSYFLEGIAYSYTPPVKKEDDKK